MKKFSIKKISTLIGLAAVCVTPTTALGQLIDVAQCVQIEDRLSRADCYDAQVARQTQAPQVVPVPVVVESSVVEPGVVESVIVEPEIVEVIDLTIPVSEQITEVVETVEVVEAESPEIALEEKLETFGTTTLSNTRIIERENGEDELHDRVASLRKRGPNRWLITLESGQIWYQTNSDVFRLKEGMDVVIYRSSFGGSFRLKRTTQNGFIQIDRVQ